MNFSKILLLSGLLGLGAHAQNVDFTEKIKEAVKKAPPGDYDEIRSWSPSRVHNVANDQDTSIAPEKTKETLDRLQSIIIPRIEFKNASGLEAYQYLLRKSIDLDPTHDAIRFLFDMRLLSHWESQDLQEPVTLSLRDVSLTKALKYVTSLTNCVYRVNGDTIIIRRIEQQ